MIHPLVEAAIKSMIDVARLAARPALDNVFRELAFTKIALVVLRELPACLTNTLGEAHAFEELQSRELLLCSHAGGVAARPPAMATVADHKATTQRNCARLMAT